MVTDDHDHELARAIADYVEDEPGLEQLGDATWRFPFDMDTGEFSVFVSVRGSMLLAYATRLDPVPAPRRSEMMQLLGDLNPELTVSWVECQRDTGTVSARSAVDLTGASYDSTLIGNVVGAAVGTMGRFLPAIDAVADGSMDAEDFLDEPDVDLVLDDPDTVASAFDRLLGD